MKKVVYTVCVDNYFPELMQYTLPNLERYARKIGAEFHIIKDRKYPEFPATYEKLQVYDLGPTNFWNVLIDADMMLHPDFPDITVFPPEYVLFHAGFEASTRFAQDQYFIRDGRDRGVTTNFVATSILCHDLWTPLEFSWEYAKQRIGREHIVDEYCVSRNLARFGLKYSGITQSEEDQYMIEHLGMADRTPEAVEELIRKAARLAQDWA